MPGTWLLSLGQHIWGQEGCRDTSTGPGGLFPAADSSKEEHWEAQGSEWTECVDRSCEGPQPPEGRAWATPGSSQRCRVLSALGLEKISPVLKTLCLLFLVPRWFWLSKAVTLMRSCSLFVQWPCGVGLRPLRCFCDVSGSVAERVNETSICFCFLGERSRLVRWCSQGYPVPTPSGWSGLFVVAVSSSWREALPQGPAVLSESSGVCLLMVSACLVPALLAH